MPIPPSRRRELSDDEFSAMVHNDLVCPHISTDKGEALSTQKWDGSVAERFWAHKVDPGRGSAGCDLGSRREVGEFLERLRAHRPGLRLVCDERNREWVNIGWTSEGWAEQRRLRAIAAEDERVRIAAGLED